MVEGLKILANTHRANIMRILHQKGRCKFAEIMQEAGLDTKKDCGTFGYHLSALTKAGVVIQDQKGFYSLTERGEAVWSLMQQLNLEAEEIMTAEQRAIVVSRFGEEDIDDYSRFVHEKIDRDSDTKFVETVTRNNHFLDGVYGSFDEMELRTHSYIARQMPGGDIVGFIFGHTYFNPTPGHILYGERKLTLKIQGYHLDPDIDKKTLVSLLLRKMIRVADDNDYHIEMQAWNPEDYEMDIFRDLGLQAFELPRLVKICRSPIDWDKEYTLRRLKAEGFNEKLIDTVGTGERFTTEEMTKKSGQGSREIWEQISKLANRRIIVTKKEGWVLSQKYQTPRHRSGEEKTDPDEEGERSGDS